jgi:hypothetical protein
VRGGCRTAVSSGGFRAEWVLGITMLAWVSVCCWWPCVLPEGQLNSMGFPQTGCRDAVSCSVITDTVSHLVLSCWVGAALFLHA